MSEGKMDLNWINVLPDAVVVVAKETGTIIAVNDQAIELFRYSRSHLIGSNVDMLVPSSVRNHHVAYRTTYSDHPRPRTMAAGQNLSAELSDGTFVPVDISLAEISPELVIAVVRDVSVREKQRLTEQKFRELTDQLITAQRETINSHTAMADLSRRVKQLEEHHAK